MLAHLCSPGELAEEFGCRRQTIARAAQRVSVGVYANNRLVAIHPKDKNKLKKAIHSGPGNPGFGTIWTGAGFTPENVAK